MYARAINRMINRYGRLCEVIPFGSDTKVRTNAFLNPLLYKNKMYIGGTYLPDGFYDGGHYLYIGKAAVRLDNLPLGSVVKCGGDTYTIKRAEQYVIADKAVYIWAVLQIAKKGEGNEGDT